MYHAARVSDGERRGVVTDERRRSYNDAVAVVVAVAVGRRGRRVQRRTVDGALAGDGRPQAEQAQEAAAEFRRHQIVEDGIDGRVQVSHNAAKVDDGEVRVGRDLDVGHQRDHTERQQAHEEAHHHRAQHGHHLSVPSPGTNRNRMLSSSRGQCLQSGLEFPSAISN